MNASKRYIESRQQLWINDTISKTLKSYIKDRVRVTKEIKLLREKT